MKTGIELRKNMQDMVGMTTMEKLVTYASRKGALHR